MINVFIFPTNKESSKFFKEYLKTKKINIVTPSFKKIHVIHFFNCRLGEIVKQIKIHKPNLVVLHSKHYPRIAYNIPYIYMPITKKKHFYNLVTVYTNNKSLSTLYLNKLQITYNLKMFTSEATYSKNFRLVLLNISKNFKSKLYKFKSKLLIA